VPLVHDVLRAPVPSAQVVPGAALRAAVESARAFWHVLLLVLSLNCYIFMQFRLVMLGFDGF